jgi:hypothetical protein
LRPDLRTLESYAALLGILIGAGVCPELADKEAAEIKVIEEYLPSASSAEKRKADFTRIQ